MPDLKVVITDLGYATYEPERNELAVLRKDRGGHADNVELVLTECKTEADVAQACRDADGVITRLAPVGAKAIAAMTKCRAISRYGVGVDNVHIPTATAKGIAVCNVRGACSEDVSDHALALLLTCVRRTASRDKQVRAGLWDIGSKEPVYRIAGKTLGLVGYGAIARFLHRKVSGLGLAEVIIFDPFVSDADAAKAGVRKVSLDELCEQADYISVHAPLNEETRHMIGPAQFARMKRTAIIVNTSRGPLIDPAALLDALKTGRIASAGIDVHEPEPPPKDSPFFTLPNVVLTDHTGWYSEESQFELQTKAARNIALVLGGKPPLFCVNPEVLKK